jgi:hypothetical protein
VRRVSSREQFTAQVEGIYRGLMQGRPARPGASVVAGR